MRILIIAFLILSSSCIIPRPGQAREIPPDIKLENGMLIWVRAEREVLIYSDGGEPVWRSERARALSEVAPEEQHLFAPIANLSYEEFRQLYFYDEVPGGAQNYSVGRWPVGHVGIIEVDGADINVIEARRLPTPGVVKTKLREWQDSLRPDERIWLGEFKMLKPNQIAAIVAAADSQVGKPYTFFNFNLSDNTGFYCSKLIWWAVYKATGLSMDEITDIRPKRFRWYSPKQMQNSRLVKIIYGKDY